MQRKTLLVSALTVLLAGSASFVMAQDAPTPPPPPGAHPMHGMDKNAMGHHGGGDHGMWHHGHGDERGGVIGDLRSLEHLYVRSGRSRELPALYNDVLAKSQDPRVRDYVYQHLARAQMQPANVDEAIATLRKGLDESLANEAKMHAEMEKMRANWQQHHADMQPPAGQPPLSR